MKASEKIKAQKIVDKIQSADFDENDVDNLFMRLRAYCGNYRIFREAADFVAHNDARNKGLLNESLEAYYLSYKYFLEYAYQKKRLDLNDPIPLYIKKLLKFQVDKCKPHVLRDKFNVTPERLKARIDTLFKDDKKSQTMELQLFKLSRDSLLPIQYLLSFIGTYPAFTDDELMKELVDVIRMNHLELDEVAFTAQQSTITLCVMLLMHQSFYEFDGSMRGECQISLDQPALILSPFEEIGDKFGNIQVMGAVSYDGHPVKLVYAIFQSNLKATEYCDASLLIQKPCSDLPGLLEVKINLEGDLVLLGNGKLGLAVPDH